MKKRQRTREELNQEYYQLAATAGDLALNIAQMRQTQRNVLSSMAVVLKQVKGMPLSDEAVEAAEAPTGDATPSEQAETPEGV